MIELIFIQSLVVCGIYLASEEGMILYPYRLLIYQVISSKYLRKPLIDCVTCMASVYGTITYIAYMWGDLSIIEWAISIPATAFLSSLFFAYYDSLD